MVVCQATWFWGKFLLFTLLAGLFAEMPLQGVVVSGGGEWKKGLVCLPRCTCSVFSAPVLTQVWPGLSALLPELWTWDTEY